MILVPLFPVEKNVFKKKANVGMETGEDATHEGV